MRDNGRWVEVKVWVGVRAGVSLALDLKNTTHIWGGGERETERERTRKCNFPRFLI